MKLPPVRFLMTAFAACALSGAIPGGAFAQAVAQAEGAAPSPAAPSAALTPEAKAAQIRALIDGDLDPAIAAGDLFRFSLAGADAPRLRAVARMVGDDDLFGQARQDLTVLSGLSPEQGRLALAEATFLRLPEQRRRTILSAHAKLHQSYRDQQQEKATAAEEVERLTQELAGLRAFQRGEPVNPDVLRINLVDGEADDGALALLSDDQVKDAPAPAEDATDAQRIAWLNAQIARERQAIFGLSPARLAELSASAGLNNGAADEIALAEAQLDTARRQLSDAEAAAINAASEHERLIASERARLLQTKQAQAQFRSNLARTANEPQTITDNALAWRRRAQEAADSGEADADTLYADLVVELTSVRRQLRQALSAPDYPAAPELLPPALDGALPDDAPETDALRTQLAGLQRDARRLREAHASQLWERRTALRDAMNMVNGARLTLLAALSSDKRARVTGFGAEGVAQVRREISEIVLELSYNFKSWRRIAGDFFSGLSNPSPGFVLALLRLVLVLLVFAWWRKRGDALLARAQVDAALKRPRTMLRTMQTAALRHWRRVRGPLDWLVLTTCLWWFWPEELAVTGLRFVWIVLFWSLATVVLVRLVNELASGRGRDDPRAALRWKSLKLIAGSLLVIGLLLNLTRASVGRGAIYSWVVTAAWLLVPVVAVLLAHWWRARIVTLAGAEAGESALLRWIARDPGGILGILGRIVVGILLLAKGVKAVFARRIRDVALVREMLEQRARIAAERQVAQDKASGRFHRLPGETLAVFDPHRPPAQRRIGNERPGKIALPAIPPGSLTLVIAERGLGKSSFLRDLAAEAGKGSRHLHLEVPPCPGADWVEGLPAMIDAKDGEDVFVTIDDIQRLIVPSIGGLGALDRMVALSRAAGPNQRWVFAIARASWRFLQRARSDRILFDAIVELPHWSAAELRDLIERRTEQAAIDPDFSAMVDDGVFEFGEDVSAAERKKRGYFERLTDYVGGNPAIALDYWRQSLFVEGSSGTVTVRTFDTPPLDSLAGLPMAAQFVLRVLLQMDFADRQAIHASTDLPDMMISDALRRLERMGAITNDNGCYRIALHWWTTVNRLLARQNLIVREA